MKKDTGIVNIHGKDYQTVAYRVNKFREQYGNEMSLITEIIYADDKVVRMKATISNIEGVIATGHAEEYRSSSNINKNSALENAETSAIGRALAALGMGGTEFASADEVARAIGGKPAAPAEKVAIDTAPYITEILQAMTMDGLKKCYIAAVKSCGELKELEQAKDIRKNELLGAQS